MRLQYRESPLFLDVQFAGWFAQSSDGEDRSDHRPGNFLPSCWQEIPEQGVQTKQPPQSQDKPNVAEIAQPLKLDTLEFDQNRLFVGAIVVVRRIKKRALWTTSAVETTAELCPPVLLSFRLLTEIGDDTTA